MQWPEWLSARKDKLKDELSSKESLKDLAPSTETLQAEIQSLKNAASQSSLNTLALCALSSATTFGVVILYLRLRKVTRRITVAEPSALQHKSLYGFVPKVGDGDGFRFYHTPGGIAQGWGWLPGRQPRKMDTKDFAKNTLSIRLAAVDAPEMAHFGKEAQPYAEEAIQWLRKAVEGRYIRIFPYRKDQYDRLVCEAETRRLLFLKTNVGLEMVKVGLATVYEAKFGGEFGDKKEQYDAAEHDAKAKGRGMWHEPGVIARLLGEKAKPVETPRQYKTRTSHTEKPAKK